MKNVWILPAVFFTSQASAQSINTINTAVPFLRITPDARASAMGDAGAATSPDAYSIFWNTAKLAFIENQFGASATYNPLTKIQPSDAAFLNASAYWKIDSISAVTASFRYFTIGKLTFTNASGAVLGTFAPREYTFHLGYARKISKHFSAGINVGYVRSKLAKKDFVNPPIEPGVSLLGDFSLYYTHPLKKHSVLRNYNLGLTISNIGDKLSYYSDYDGDFLPSNLRLGSNFNFQFGNTHQLEFAFDLNKLLVPTPDTAGNYLDESVAEGIFKSFTDAPGGVHEELQETDISIGAEYWWKKMIAFRTGYFYESPYKGNRQYFCFGAGIRYHWMQLDYSYQLHASGHAFGNDMRISLSLDIPSFRNSSQKKS